MKIRKEKQMIQPALLLTVCFTLFLASVFVGRTYASYEASLKEELTFGYQGDMGLIYLLSSEKDENGAYAVDENGYFNDPGNWELVETEDEGQASYVLSFLLANGRNARIPCESDQKATLALFATVGVQLAEDLTIVLSDGQSAYTAIAAPVTEGMMWYDSYGPGWIYRFYNAAGEELTWPLPGGIFTARELTLTVSGQSEKVAAFRLVAFAQPGLSDE